MRAALGARGASARIVTNVIRRLHDLHYLDDRRFAMHVAERAVRRGFGSERVRAELTQKGIREAWVEEAVTSTFTDETALARAVCERRFGADPLPPAQRGKAARFLHGRGFPEGIVLAILDEGC